MLTTPSPLRSSSRNNARVRESMPPTDAADWMRVAELAIDAKSDVAAGCPSKEDSADATGSFATVATGSFATVAADVPSMSKWAANSCSVKTRSPSLSSFWKNS